MVRTMKNITRVGKATAAGLVSLSLAAMPLGSYAFADESDVLKEETIYVKTGASGAAEGVYVVNMFDGGVAATVEDPAAYQSVKNLSTFDDLAQTDGVVSIKTEADRPVYYQGTLDSATQLPWDIAITFELDGREVSADEAAGATGKLRIVLDVKALDDGSDISDFSNSYVLQAQGTFDEDHLRLTDAGDATLARAGNNTIVACMVLPGESHTFELEGDARDFSYDGWQVSAMPLSMAIDLASQDTSALSDKTNELKDATEQLADGTGKLADGASDLQQGASKLEDASGDFQGGWSSISQGISEVRAGADALAAGSNQFAQGIAAMKKQEQGNASGLGDAQLSYAAAMEEIRAQMTEIQTQLNAGSSDPQAIAGSLNNIAGLLARANTAVEQIALVSGSAGAAQALASVESNYSKLADGIGSLSAGLGKLDAGTGSFADGLSDYTGGVGALSSGARDLVNGGKELNDGAITLADSVKDIDSQILDELQEVIDEKLGTDFKAHSFVVSSNTDVSQVQFVYVVEGVSADAENENDNSEELENEDKSFIDRLLALFS